MVDKTPVLTLVHFDVCKGNTVKAEGVSNCIQWELRLCQAVRQPVLMVRLACFVVNQDVATIGKLIDAIRS